MCIPSAIGVQFKINVPNYGRFLGRLFRNSCKGYRTEAMEFGLILI
jgi:hypothetical protein